ncbi:MAG: hypothetical protein KF773_13580 [Deltaproteobacteria bacterium]|nr:hypothetical protein [Deltaproteobacteria bacterium]
MDDERRTTRLGFGPEPEPQPEPAPTAPPPSSPAFSTPVEGPHATPPAFPPPPPAQFAPATPPPDPHRALAQVTPKTAQQIETLSTTFFNISLRRAFRLRIKTDEVLPSERAHLESQAAHITDPDQQSFLAWRRSVLLLVAMMFIPLTVFRFIETWDGIPMPTAARIFLLLPALAEGALCVVAFHQLRNWANWRKQRRILFYAWAIYFLAPFIVYIYPYRGAIDVRLYWQVAKLGEVHIGAGNALTSDTARIFIGLAVGLQAMIALGPKVISLMPGLIRASIVTKLLFPGTTAPGWLMVLAAPVYALFAYIIILLPYQVTGSWQFVVGNLGILGAQVFIGISGRRLTVPLTADESAHRIKRSWTAYISILVVSAGFMIYGLYAFVSQLHLGYVRVITGVLAFVSNVLLDTLIGTDAIVAAMAHFRRRGIPDPRDEHLLRDAETKLGTFVR